MAEERKGDAETPETRGLEAIDEMDDWNPYKVDQDLGKRMEVLRLRFQLSLDDATSAGVDAADVRRALMEKIAAYGARGDWRARGGRRKR